MTANGTDTTNKTKLQEANLVSLVLGDDEPRFLTSGSLPLSTPAHLFRHLGLPKDASVDERQARLDEWVAAGNRPSSVLAAFLEDEGYRLPHPAL